MKRCHTVGAQVLLGSDGFAGAVEQDFHPAFADTIIICWNAITPSSIRIDFEAVASGRCKVDTALVDIGGASGVHQQTFDPIVMGAANMIDAARCAAG